MINSPKRQKGPRILPTIKNLIVSEAIRYYNKPRAALAAEVRDTIERMGEISPSDETLMRMISEARNKKPEDKPWNIGALRQYPEITPLAVPLISLVQDWAANNNEPPVTVRQAYWVSRLYAFAVKDIYRTKEKELRHLWTLSHLYAYYEVICEISGTDTDTTELDMATWEGRAGDLIVNLALKDISNLIGNI